ncbi:Patatin [Methylobacterium sp. 4-46]|uniref:patatin-like phospholipase family protein n=1 Tax=unclassified Methylobacterium TaxID=2615210 RepID=UPI000165CB64|nr:MULTISPECIES: patatin-like phospholipase family protein [Methylobacterium]ACA19583.1 Patatin [Methylobacterium sp. 4-46]WFT78778.1 patatin-like phospholipase family protein [Methylobacterium nodulans]
MFHRSHPVRGLLAALVAAPIAACSSIPRAPYTAAEAAVATVPGQAPTIRYWADAPASAFAEVSRAAVAQKEPFTYLALSGGGGDGAYGAGVLNGWSETGRRPVFTLVSGVSTGALIAPFAFLGPAYDPTLREIYTSGIASTLVQSPNPLNILLGDGLFADQRLRDLVGRYVTPEILAQVAEEHRKGRRLLVVTTNLDAQRAVIWDMGAIAASGQPNAVALFRDVLAASASVPAVFPPMLIDAQAGSHGFQEMHVDGAVATPVFTLPESFLSQDSRIVRGRGKPNIYVVINGRIEPSFDLVQNRTLSIASRTLSTVGRARSRATLASTAAFARRNGIGFNLTYIDRGIPEVAADQGFDTAYMRSLFEDGYAKARSGSLWETTLPRDAQVERQAELR